MVWGGGDRLDHLHGVLPVHAAPRVRVLALAREPRGLAAAELDPHRAPRREPRVLLLLFATVGLPYFLLSSTSPLIQAWFAREFPGSSPYRLFALSNLASMLALLGYPFLFEPWLASPAQSWAWSGGYALFVATCAALGWRSRGLPALERAAASAAMPPPKLVP